MFSRLFPCGCCSPLNLGAGGVHVVPVTNSLDARSMTITHPLDVVKLRRFSCCRQRTAVMRRTPIRRPAHPAMDWSSVTHDKRRLRLWEGLRLSLGCVLQRGPSFAWLSQAIKAAKRARRKLSKLTVREPSCVHNRNHRREKRVGGFQVATFAAVFLESYRHPQTFLGVFCGASRTRVCFCVGRLATMILSQGIEWFQTRWMEASCYR